jgi:DNA adenine methylase
MDTRSNYFEAEDQYVKAADYVQSPFRYPGGKFYALKYILPLLNCVPHQEYREPFVGGGSVFFGKPKAQHNWINDLEDDVINVYKAISSNTRNERLIERVSRDVATKERHSEVKLMKAITLDDRAFKTFYLNRTSYSGIIKAPAWGYEIGMSAPPENWHKPLRNANNKLKGVRITSKDFSEVIEEPSDRAVLMYLDPPYFLADQKRAYTKHFELSDHLRLERCLNKTEHFFCLSYDDCKEIRDLYEWAYIYERTWFYNTANSKGPRKIGKELLITNYKVEHKGQLEFY